MPFYRDHIYPHLVSLLANPEPIRRVRQRIVPLAQGQVLEIGVGPGVNFVHYDPARVSKLIFFELGLSPDPQVRRWQEWWEPIHHWVFEGLHLTRDIPSLVTQGGFQIEQVETAYLARFPKSWAHCWWGTAVPQSP